MGKEWYVAYLDILGVTNKLNDGESYENLVTTLEAAYKQAIESSTPSREDSYLWELQYKVFSDNIVFAARYHDDVYDANVLLKFLTLVNTFQWNLFTKYGLLLRGAICRGCITFKNNLKGMDFVVGPALVKAYELESKYAICPRVLFDDIVYDDILEFYPTMKKIINIEKDDIVSEDIDGKHYLNYIVSLVGDMIWCNEDTQIIMDRLIQKSGTKINDLRVSQKYEWVRSKLEIEYNRFLGKKDK